MNETTNENEDWQEVPVTVEFVPADSDETNQITDSTDTESSLPNATRAETFTDDLFNTEGSTMDLTEETAETVPEDTVTLQQIHYDLLVVIFLLLFIWLYERMKAGIRNTKKITK